LATLRARAENLSDYRQRTETARKWIADGEVNPGVLETYDSLVGFLNGYLSLDESTRRRARAFASFVITLNKSGIRGERRTTSGSSSETTGARTRGNTNSGSPRTNDNVPKSGPNALATRDRRS
jgi:hypothetical protein